MHLLLPKRWAKTRITNRQAHSRAGVWQGSPRPSRQSPLPRRGQLEQGAQAARRTLLSSALVCTWGCLRCWMSPESNKISGLGSSEIRPLLLPLRLVCFKSAISQSVVEPCGPRDEERKRAVAFEQSQRRHLEDRLNWALAETSLAIPWNASVW